MTILLIDVIEDRFKVLAPQSLHSMEAHACTVWWRTEKSLGVANKHARASTEQELRKKNQYTILYNVTLSQVSHSNKH